MPYRVGEFVTGEYDEEYGQMPSFYMSGTLPDGRYIDSDGQIYTIPDVIYHGMDEVIKDKEII